MPIGGPNASGGGSAFGLSRLRRALVSGGVSFAGASRRVTYIPEIGMFLASAGGIQSYNAYIPQMCTDPRVGDWEPLPNYPKTASDIALHLLTTSTHHFFNLRVGATNEFWRATLDFSTWTQLAIPPASPVTSSNGGFIFVPNGSVFGPMIMYANTSAGASWELKFSTDDGANWTSVGLPSVSFPSVWQSQFLLGVTPAGNIILGLRDSIGLLGPLYMAPPLAFPVIAAANVGTGGNSYTSFGIAPDGRCAAGVNIGRLCYSTDFGLTWAASEPLTSGSGNDVHNIIHNVNDDYFYIQTTYALARTMDFSDFEPVPMYADPQASDRITEDKGNGPIDGGFILTPDLTATVPAQFWSLF